MFNYLIDLTWFGVIYGPSTPLRACRSASTGGREMMWWGWEMVELDEWPVQIAIFLDLHTSADQAILILLSIDYVSKMLKILRKLNILLFFSNDVLGSFLSGSCRIGLGGGIGGTFFLCKKWKFFDDSSTRFFEIAPESPFLLAFSLFFLNTGWSRRASSRAISAATWQWSIYLPLSRSFEAIN